MGLVAFKLEVKMLLKASCIRAGQAPTGRLKDQPSKRVRRRQESWLRDMQSEGLWLL